MWLNSQGTRNTQIQEAIDRHFEEDIVHDFTCSGLVYYSILRMAYNVQLEIAVIKKEVPQYPHIFQDIPECCVFTSTG